MKRINRRSMADGKSVARDAFAPYPAEIVLLFSSRLGGIGKTPKGSNSSAQGNALGIDGPR